MSKRKAKSRHIGRSTYRFRDNPLEKTFADKWQEVNDRYPGNGIIDYLMAEDSNRPYGEVTDRDAEVAATVVQWLGSPVGQGFVRDILSLHDLEVVPSDLVKEAKDKKRSSFFRFPNPFATIFRT